MRMRYLRPRKLAAKDTCPKKFPASTTFPAKESRVKYLILSTLAMAASQRVPMNLLRSLLLVLALNVLLPTEALYFYLDGASANPKCFYEELPKDTMVVGEHPFPKSSTNVTSD